MEDEYEQRIADLRSDLAAMKTRDSIQQNPWHPSLHCLPFWDSKLARYFVESIPNPSTLLQLVGGGVPRAGEGPGAGAPGGPAGRAEPAADGGAGGGVAAGGGADAAGGGAARAVPGQEGDHARPRHAPRDAQRRGKRARS